MRPEPPLAARCGHRPSPGHWAVDFPDVGRLTSVAHYENASAHRQFPGTRPFSADDFLASAVRYAYDGAGRRVYLWDGYGPTWYTYDTMGALQEERSPRKVVSYTYDVLMRR